MTLAEKIKLIHIIVLPFAALIIWMLFPGQAEKSWERNRKWAGVFLPGRWKEKEYFVFWTRRLAVFWLVFFTTVYFSALYLVLKDS